MFTLLPGAVGRQAAHSPRPPDLFTGTVATRSLVPCRTPPVAGPRQRARAQGAISPHREMPIRPCWDHLGVNLPPKLCPTSVPALAQALPHLRRATWDPRHVPPKPRAQSGVCRVCPCWQSTP